MLTIIEYNNYNHYQLVQQSALAWRIINSQSLHTIYSIIYLHYIIILSTYSMYMFNYYNPLPLQNHPIPIVVWVSPRTCYVIWPNLERLSTNCEIVSPSQTLEPYTTIWWVIWRENSSKKEWKLGFADLKSENWNIKYTVNHITCTSTCNCMYNYLDSKLSMLTQATRTMVNTYRPSSTLLLCQYWTIRHCGCGFNTKTHPQII